MCALEQVGNLLAPSPSACPADRTKEKKKKKKKWTTPSVSDTQKVDARATRLLLKLRQNRMRRMMASLPLAAACVLLALALAPAAQADDKLKDLIKVQGIVEIKLIEAQVPDLDPLPMQKDSDVFVRVYLNDTKELVCESQIVQDENNPKFDKECKTSKPVPSSTVLRMEIFDSDKPAPDPDWVGMTKVKISDLILNRKLDSKESFPIEGRQFPKYFLKAKIDFKPEK